MAQMKDESASVPPQPPGGLYEGFEAYRTPTDVDYHNLLTNGVVIPDANVLLNLYRYNEDTRNDLFAIMRSLGDRLWVPHQVIREFWRNRTSVLQDPRSTEATVRELISHRDKTIELFRSWANRVGLSEERAAELRDAVARGYEAMIEGVRSLTEANSIDAARDTHKDKVLAQLELILRGHVGPPLSSEDYDNAVATARRRSDAKRPPGYRDANKEDDAAAGDYLVWLQTLREARSRNRNVLMVTGDVKEDWWRREQGETRGPRPELVEEMWNFAGVNLFIIRPESLLLVARRVLQIDVSDQSVKEVERVERWQEWEDYDPDYPALEDIQQAWPEIVEALHAVSRVAWIQLATASPMALDGKVLTVHFPVAGTAKGFLAAENDRRLEDVLRRTYDVELNVNVTHSVLQNGDVG